MNRRKPRAVDECWAGHPISAVREAPNKLLPMAGGDGDCIALYCLRHQLQYAVLVLCLDLFFTYFTDKLQKLKALQTRGIRQAVPAQLVNRAPPDSDLAGAR